MTVYLICANDYLQTAFFCGSGKECMEILGFKNMNVFYSSISHKRNVFGGFAHIERINIDEQ